MLVQTTLSPGRPPGSPDIHRSWEQALTVMAKMTTRLQQCGTVALLSIVIATVASFTARGQETPFEALHIERSATVELDGTPDAVFALLEPLGRQRWVTRWRMEYLYPPSGNAEAGAVIRHVHRSGAVEQIWLLAEREPPSRIKYVIFVAGMEIWEFDVRLQPGPPGRTRATVNHRITSLAPQVNAEVRAFADGFDVYVERWRSALNEALRTDGR